MGESSYQCCYPSVLLSKTLTHQRSIKDYMAKSGPFHFYHAILYFIWFFFFFGSGMDFGQHPILIERQSLCAGKFPSSFLFYRYFRASFDREIDCVFLYREFSFGSMPPDESLKCFILKCPYASTG